MKYFKHGTDLRFEPESRKLIKKYGLAGYGLYCAILEITSAGIETKKVEPALSECPEDIADYFNEEAEKIYEMLAYAEEKNIVSLSGRKYLCRKVHTLLDEYLSKSTVMKKSMEEYLNGESGCSEAEEVLEHLNSLIKGGGKKGYKAIPSNLDPIEARLKEGHSVDDCKAVNLFKFNDWNGSSMSKYIRPQTLFRKSKFEGYLNEASGPVMTEEQMRQALRIEA